MKTVFTTGEVAKHCKVANRTAAKWFDSGKLKGYRIPGSQDRRIPRDKLISFLKDYGMPLGKLEDEQQYAVLLVAVDLQTAAWVKKALPLEDGYRYASAESTFHAGVLINEFRPNCIVIDLNIGRAESVQAVKLMRQQEKHASTEIIAIIGEDSSDEFAQALIDSGFSSTHRQPIDPLKLAKSIAEAAAQHRAN
jgi:two-component system response regulator RpaA